MICEAPATSEDAFLGGRLKLRQPVHGHRSGLEAVLIAAAAPLRSGDTILDIGAGVGAAGLCALARVPQTQAVLVEADSGLCALAAGNAEANGLAGRVDVACCDVVRPPTNLRAALAAQADHAVCNPPFHDPAAARLSPARSAAHGIAPERLDAWFRFAAGALKAGGTLTLVHRADALSLVLVGLGRRFGDVRILPLHPRPGRAAARILISARKGSRTPLSVLPGLVLHGEDGHGFTPQVEAVLRAGAPLTLAEAAP